MADYDLFVGREEELAQISTIAERWGERNLVLIEGMGGIGKTFLLRNIEQKYRASNNFIVDYYDLAHMPPGDWRQARHLIDSIGAEHFPQFQAGFVQLSSGDHNIIDPKFDKIKNDIFMQGGKELKAVLKDNRLISIIDTLDIDIPGYSWMEGLYRHFIDVPNILLIIAGRKAFELAYDLEKRSFTPDQVTKIPLKRFELSDADLLFNKIADGRLTQEMRAKIHFLSGGRPVLLSLAVEWYYRNMPLPKGMEKSLEYLENLPQNSELLRTLRKEFEFELVDQIRNLKEPLDHALLYMALVDRRNNINILSSLLGKSIEETKPLVQQLLTLPFVKSSPDINGGLVEDSKGKFSREENDADFSLHDEMKNLINVHAWPYIDSGDVRRKLMRIVVDNYYTNHIEEINREVTRQRSDARLPEISQLEWELWQLEADRLHYLLAIDEEEGSEYYKSCYWDALRNGQDIRIDFLRYEIENASNPDIQDMAELSRANSLWKRGDWDGAYKICAKLISKDTLSSNNRFSAYNILGLITKNDDIQESIKAFEKAFEIAKDLQDTRRQAIASNNLGQIFRHRYELDKATDYYDQAIRLATRSNDATMRASARNNLADIYRLRGTFDQANALCQLAMSERKKIGSQLDIAYSYITQAEIDADRRSLQDAERNAKIALQMFGKLDNEVGEIQSYGVFARIARYLGNYKEAEAYIIKAIALAEKEKEYSLLADLYNVYGRQLRGQAEDLLKTNLQEDQDEIERFFDKAYHKFIKSVEYAEKIGNAWFRTRSKFELAMIHHYSKQYYNEKASIELLDEVLQGPKEDIFVGHVEEMYGRIASRQKKYHDAAKHFGKASYLLKDLGTPRDKFSERITGYILNPQLTSDEAVTLAQGVLDSIEAYKEYNSFLRTLAMLCEDVLNLHSLDNGGAQ